MVMLPFRILLLPINIVIYFFFPVIEINLQINDLSTPTL